MGLGPKKPSISGEKTLKTYNLQNIVLSLAYLKHAQDYPTLGQNHLAWNLLDNKVWKISCNWLNTVLKVKQNDYMGQSGWLSVCWWFTLVIMGLHHGRGSHHTLLAPERSRFNIQSMVSYWMPITSVPSESQKLLSHAIVSQGLFIVLSWAF